MDRKPSVLQSIGLQSVGHRLVARLKRGKEEKCLMCFGD